MNAARRFSRAHINEQYNLKWYLPNWIKRYAAAMRCNSFLWALAIYHPFFGGVIFTQTLSLPHGFCLDNSNLLDRIFLCTHIYARLKVCIAQSTLSWWCGCELMQVHEHKSLWIFNDVIKHCVAALSACARVKTKSFYMRARKVYVYLVYQHFMYPLSGSKDYI